MFSSMCVGVGEEGELVYRNYIDSLCYKIEITETFYFYLGEILLFVSIDFS